MYQCSGYRIQNTGNGKNNCCKVQCHGKGQIQFDGLHHPFRQCQQMWQFPYIIIDQCNICCIYCNVTSDSAKGDSNVCLLQRRRIIYTVPNG